MLKILKKIALFGIILSVLSVRQSIYTMQKKVKRAIQKKVKRKRNSYLKTYMQQTPHSMYTELMDHLNESKKPKNLKQPEPKLLNFAMCDTSETKNHEETARQILNQYGPNKAIHCAITNNKPGVAQYLINSDEANVNGLDEDNATPLHVAVLENDTEIIMDLVHTGKIDINAVDKNKITPLYLAIFNNNSKIVQYLIEQGAKVNIKEKTGTSPLHQAVLKGNLVIVKHLSAAQANLNITDNNNNTPLHCAIYKGNPDIAKLLLENGAIIDSTNKKGQTPLYMLLEQFSTIPKEKMKEIATLLINNGANIYAKDKYKDTPLNLARKIDSSLNIEFYENILLKPLGTKKFNELTKKMYERKTKLTFSGNIFGKKIPVITDFLRKDLQKTKCCCCFEPIYTESCIILYPCKHFVHLPCLKNLYDKAMTGKYRCPICRTKIQAIEGIKKIKKNTNILKKE